MKPIFSNREVVLGITGSIAAYKACEIASRLVQAGARVTPVMTASAQQLVGPATLEAITGRPAITGLFAPFSSEEIEHIAVARRAHVFLIAPATANCLAKAALGIADDWLSTTLLATRAPILFAPAMNDKMYAHPATQANMAALRARGCHFVGPAPGRLACGTEGMGRMIDPSAILEAAIPLVSGNASLEGRRVIITSGGNHEPIDPVRFIGNRSSGKMGRALALAALARKADVTVVTGPAETPLPYGVRVIPAETALDMARALEPVAADADIIIGAAAVADYRVENPAAEKRKRTGGSITITLLENPDILAGIAAHKRPGQIIAGFAAETQDLAANAAIKCAKKNLDLVVANEVGVPHSGFGADTTQAGFAFPNGIFEPLPLMSKDELAGRLLDRIADMLANQE